MFRIKWMITNNVPVFHFLLGNRMMETQLSVMGFYGVSLSRQDHHKKQRPTISSKGFYSS